MIIDIEEFPKAARRAAEAMRNEPDRAESFERECVNQLDMLFKLAAFVTHPKRMEDMAQAAETWQQVKEGCTEVLKVVHQGASSVLIDKLLDYRNEAEAREMLHRP